MAKYQYTTESLAAFEIEYAAQLEREKAQAEVPAAAVLGQAGSLASPPQASVPASEVFRDLLKDGSRGPAMVRISSGRFMMGSSPTELGHVDAESPRHQVTIGADFALGKFPVTVGEFRRFVEASAFRTQAQTIGACFSGQGKRDGATWRNPGFRKALSDRHPVVCVTFRDALAFAQWLSAQTGKNYRLPTEAEWEYTARAGTMTSRFWGDDPAQACRFANAGDRARSNRGGNISGTPHACVDRFAGPAPVGKFQANAFGLHDMLGNVWEWTADCWSNSYAGTPVDGSALGGDGCRQHVRRGGNFSSGAEETRSAARKKGRPPAVAIGFRLARDL